MISSRPWVALNLHRLRLLVIAAASVGLIALEVFRHFVLHPAENLDSSHLGEHFLSGALLLSGVVAFSLAIFRLLVRVQSELAKLHDQLGSLRERERIGMDLHDGVVQHLYGIGLQLEGAAEQLSVDADAAGETIEDAQQQLRGVVVTLRAYAHDLRDGEGSIDLIEALAHVVDELGHAGPEIELQAADYVRLPAITASNVVQVVREALGNSLRHASASKILVRAVMDDGCLAVSVTDDGRGFDLNLGSSSGMGLRNMHERAQALGTALSIDSAVGRGTKVAMRLRCDDGPEASR